MSFEIPSSGMGKHKVSVIMPAYNGEKYIAAAMRSVLAQTYEDLELIVVDDGSSDRTSEIVRGIEAADERVVYIFQTNAGQGNARNTGIKSARGELIAFLDQDDLWIEAKLERQLEALKETKADVVFSGSFVFHDDNVTDETIPWDTLRGRFDGATMFPLLFLFDRIPMLSAMVRKDALHKVGLLEEDRRCQNCDDYDLWLKLAECGATFVGLSERLVRYRLHGNQASHNTVRMIRTQIALMEKWQHSKYVTEQIKRDRFQSLYRELISTLIDEGKTSEAKAVLKELDERSGQRPLSLWERNLIRILPGQYKTVCKWTDRVIDSFSYRIKRPAKSLYHKSIAPAKV
jgi:teichuronic acid biosynthesis glycosyltransferase TuaG